jgi:hypothetical protein
MSLRTEGVRLRTRVAAIAGVTAFLVLAGTGAGYAYWTASSTVQASAQSTNAAVSLAASSALTTTYTNASTGPVIGPLTISNTGGAPLGLALTASSTNSGLSGAISLRLWLQSGGSCGAAVPSSGVTTGTLAAPPALPAGATNANAGASVVVCAATAFTGNYASYAGQSAIVTFTVTGSVGANWRPTATAAITQSLAQPSAVSCTNTSPASGYQPWGWNLDIAFAGEPASNQAYQLYIVAGPSGPVSPPVRIGSTTGYYPHFQIGQSPFSQDGTYTLEVGRFPSGNSSYNAMIESLGTIQVTRGTVGNIGTPVRCGA